jgi:hypothetical protein
MSLQRIAAAFAVLVLQCYAPVAASAGAPETGSPVVLRAYRVDAGNTVEFRPTFAAVVFENTAKMTATQVVFQSEVGGAIVDRYYDAGIFAPGATLTHSFLDFSDAAGQRIRITEVRFSDGTSWNAPDLIQ